MEAKLNVQMAQRIELWPVDRLKPYERNARTHSPEQIAQICASIAEFGFTNPILVDSSDGIIAGHGRLNAAYAMGLSTVPVVVLDHLSERQRRAYILADNQLALNAGWDTELLRMELTDLQDEDFDLSVIGFSDDELADLLPDVEELPPEDADADEVPEPPVEPVSKPGDVWLLGKHRVMCGDSLKMKDTRRLMGNTQADVAFCSMSFTDPPWNVDYGDKIEGREILNDSQPEKQWRQFISDFAASLFDVTHPGAAVYVVMGSQEWPVVDAALRAASFHWSSTLVWVKDRFVMTRKDYHAQFEPIWYGWNGTAPRLMPLTDRTQSDVWEFPRPKVSPLHPMTKPVELIKRALTNSSKKNAVVTDLFGGSGSTLIACEETGRQARLMELDPRYCDVIVKRWQQFTGKRATLEATGKPFPEVAT
jgi:hypothetical protein